MLKNPIQRLSTQESGIYAEVLVRDMTFNHALFWHEHVQPHIDKNYQHYRQGIDENLVRADVGWDWRKNYALAWLYSGFPLCRRGSSAAKACVIVIKAEDGQDVPIGMLTAVPAFRCNVDGNLAPRSFTWFLSDAPAEFYDALSIQPLRQVAIALLDTAIQLGLDTGSNGELLLHADPFGGEKLHKFYGERCGMQRLPADNGNVSPQRRGSPTEYYFMSAAQSAKFCDRLDALR